MEQYIPWIISAASVLIAFLSYTRADRKDDSAEHESLTIANIKLDQIGVTVNETRADIKAMHTQLQEQEKRITIVERDLKTAFNLIDDLK